MDITKKEISTLIRTFVNGGGGPWDWDDFVSVKQRDPEMEQLRWRIIEVQKTFPRTKGRGWCSEEGMKELLKIADSLAD